MKIRISKGFTLIELLVVVSIIGVLATIVLGSLGKARNATKDTARVATLKHMETALELYYLDNNEYPQANYSFGINNAQNGNGSGNNTNPAALNFINDINPYLKNVDINEVLLGGNSRWGSFYYKSVAANNYQTYGAMIDTSSSRIKASENDGGYFPSTTVVNQASHTEGHYQSAFEIGQDPKYCKETYFTSMLGALTRCREGN